MLEINIVGEIVTMSDDCSRNDSPVQVTESYDLYGMLAGSNSQKILLGRSFVWKNLHLWSGIMIKFTL